MGIGNNIDLAIFLTKLLREKTINYEIPEWRQACFEARVKWRGNSDSPDDHIIRIGPLVESDSGTFLIIARK
ncbi:MAG: hypothetical protein P1Q69_11055 [Candidatus Thorarchaeota archaeon]|nr:hypothetical protein [Candidatus Thorarchaeota archaeon]